MSAGNRSEKSKNVRLNRQLKQDQLAAVKHNNGGLGQREVRRIASGKREAITHAERDAMRKHLNASEASYIATAPKKEA